MSRKAKGSGFKMRSSNKTSFKMMGSSSPTKLTSYYRPFTPEQIRMKELRHQVEQAAQLQRYLAANPGMKQGARYEAIMEDDGTRHGKFKRKGKLLATAEQVKAEQADRIKKYGPGSAAALEYEKFKTENPDSNLYTGKYLGSEEDQISRQQATIRHGIGRGRRRRPTAPQVQDPLENLSTDDFWSQYSF